MAIIDPGAPLPLRNISLRLNEMVQVNRSGWTGTRQAVALPGAAYWSVAGEFVPVIGSANVLRWRAFFVSLRGSMNKFRVRVVQDQQTGASNPTVRTGATAGTSVPLQGLPASSTVLLAGMMMTVTLPSGHERLVCLTANLTSNGSGQGTATFVPELSEAPTAGAAVEIRWPTALVALTAPVTGWDVVAGKRYSFAIEAEEAR